MCAAVVGIGAVARASRGRGGGGYVGGGEGARTCGAAVLGTTCAYAPHPCARRHHGVAPRKCPPARQCAADLELCRKRFSAEAFERAVLPRNNGTPISADYATLRQEFLQQCKTAHRRSKARWHKANAAAAARFAASLRLIRYRMRRRACARARVVRQRCSHPARFGAGRARSDRIIHPDERTRAKRVSGSV